MLTLSRRIHWQVEGRVFKVLRRSFENDSEQFRNMFTLPTGEVREGPVEGTDAQRPVRLEGIRRHDMVQFLKVLYPRYVATGFRIIISISRCLTRNPQALRRRGRAVRRRVGRGPAARDPVGLQGYSCPRNAQSL